MKFMSLGSSECQKSVLKSDFKSSKKFGMVNLGETYFFFKKTFHIYYIGYSEIERIFRRVYLIPLAFGKNARQLEVENIVIQSKGCEVAQIKLSKKALAKEILDAIKEKAPSVILKSPSKKEKTK